MAPLIMPIAPVSAKMKHLPPGIQTNGISSSASPSPSLSARGLPSANFPLGSAPSNGGIGSAGPRSASKIRRDTSAQLLGRGQRTSSAGLRSASIAGETVVAPVAESQPYVKSDAYILKKYRGCKPSLIIHLHTTHFRFDHQEGSFSYKSPMKILLEHLKKRTIPHELIDFFTANNVAFYQGCMIVQIHDHKSSALSLNSKKSDTALGKFIPFSLHNYNPSITPSAYVPYPFELSINTKLRNKDAQKDEDKKSSAERDKENMPAPKFDTNSHKRVSQKKSGISTIVLHPNALSGYIELATKAITPKTTPADGRRDSRKDPVYLSSSTLGPYLPTPAVPSTPGSHMAPPAKRIKTTKMELDSSNLYLAEARIILATNAPLTLDSVVTATESAALLESLKHHMHSEKPPQPTTRKRTIAEMAADEALAAEQERFMLIMDERLSVSKGGAHGGGQAIDGGGQAGGAAFEPRFERFKTLENIKLQHEELRRVEKARSAEMDRIARDRADRERQRAAADEERRQQLERQRALQAQQQMQQTRDREAHRRAIMAAHQQQTIQGMSTHNQGPHGHPQQNGLSNVMPSGVPGQPQRFHQQVSQAQTSSPIIRDGTPHSVSSPAIGNMGNVAMQHSTSSMGGSLPRPGSVVHQTPSQIPSSHPMTIQRSQQSHASDTPRMANSTPIIQSTPLSRQVSATPRMGAASPQQPQLVQTPHMGKGPGVVMINGQLQQLTPKQQQQYQNQQQQMLQRLQAQAQAQAMRGMMDGQQQMSPQQLAHQQQLRNMQMGNGVPQQGPQIAQNYAAQMAAMQRSAGGMAMNSNPGANNPMMTPMQIQHLHHMQQQHFQQRNQAQRNPQMSQANPQQMLQAQFAQTVEQRAREIFNANLPLLSERYNGNIPTEVLDNLENQCRERCVAQIPQEIAQRNKQQQMMIQQGGMSQNMHIMGRQM